MSNSCKCRRGAIRVTSKGPAFNAPIPLTGEFLTEQRVAAILRGVAVVNSRVSGGPSIGAILSAKSDGQVSPGLQQQILAGFRERFGAGCPSRTNFVRSIVSRRRGRG